LVRRFARLAALALLLAGCREPGRVDARDYDAFWLWGGVTPQPVLERARIIYLLAGEVRDGKPVRYVSLRATPRLTGKKVWLVVRTDTLHWPDAAYQVVLAQLEQWRAAGNDVRGLQVDFDARTRHLEEYAHFLEDLRRRLPRNYALSITGLLDWSAHGDLKTLRTLRGTVDEVVIQTYQGRGTIPDYDAYFDRLRDFDLPFRVGLVQGGRWIEPTALRRNPSFKGYVVFLVNPRRG
jgi:Protein of unknown function (DUF3142)